jgi:transcriptional regulator with XRE-family HTH domain
MAKYLASPYFAISGGTGITMLRHTSLMAKTSKIQWFAREWRKKKGWTLEKAAANMGMAVSYLSDLEKGNRRWNQDHLDTMALAYGMDPEDLFWDPAGSPPLWVVIHKISPADRGQAAKVLETFIKKTGTEG